MSDQEELELYPNHAGFTKTGTSQMAANAIDPKRLSILKRVHQAIAGQPGTPDEISRRIHVHYGSVRPRCSELIALGIIEVTGVRRENNSGAMADELRSIVPPQFAVYKRHV